MKPQDSIRYECFDLREHAAFLEERRVALQPAAPLQGRRFRTTFSARYMEKAHVARVSYGAAFRVLKSEPAWCWRHVLSMPVEGGILSAGPGRESVAHAQAYALRPPASEQAFETEERTDELFLALDPAHLRTTCARLLGRPLPSDIVFQPVMQASLPHARAIRAACMMYLGERADETAGAASARDEQFQDFFANTLLMHQPHNYWEELTGRAPLPAPRDVKRTIEYVRANLTEAIRLDDLIAVANVPGRTLNEHFRRFLDVSPMGYVKQERLKLARSMLLEREGRRVTEVATLCGFFHLGRFSAEYRRAFGESPSETRARAARPPGAAGRPGRGRRA